MTTKFGAKQRRGRTTGIPERSPAPLHYAVVRPGEKELEVLRIRLEGKGEVLPVFSAAWASRGYLFAEAPGGGWYVSTYTPVSSSPCSSGPASASNGWRLTPGRARAAGARALMHVPCPPGQSGILADQS